MKKICLFLCLSLALHAKPVLRIYTTESFQSSLGNELKKEFEEKEGASIQYILCQGAYSIVLDLKNEKKPADGFIGLSSDLVGEPSLQKYIAPHQIPMGKLKLPRPWTEARLLPLFYNALAFVYHTKKIPSPITSFEELAKANHKIILIDPRTSHPGLGLLLWVKDVFGEKALSFWKQLQKNVLTVAKSWSEAYALFLQGESPIVLSYVTSPAYHRLKENKLDIAAFRFREGHFLQVYCGGIAERSEHPELMRKFLEYALRPAAQKILVYRDWVYPVVDLGEPLPKEFEKQDDFKIPFSPALIEQHKREWVDEWLAALSS